MPEIEPSTSNLIDELQSEIPGRMRVEKLPGLSIAITDADRTIWEAGFGVIARNHKQPVTARTIFSLQSCSKMYTATAVLLAVQDGLLSLDTPIHAYLPPDYTIQSRYDAHPKDIITLRHLLSHKAGFTHEAPVGNNFVYDTAGATFADHIASIQRTWLRFPVGQRYSYSNLGIDLAGYILQEASHLAFAEYVRIKLLEPLGMTRTSFDYSLIAIDEDRATGHDALYAAAGHPVPLIVPMVPSGGIYSSAADAARYIRFHLRGWIDETAPILDHKYLQEMYTLPWPLEGQVDGYGFGIAINHHRGLLRLTHSGGGFGFLSDMIWYPQIGIGIALLTNSVNHRLQWSYANQILDKILDLPVYQEKVKQASTVVPVGENPSPVKKTNQSLEMLTGQYVSRAPGQCRIKQAGEGLSIYFGREKKGKKLVFLTEDRAYSVDPEAKAPETPAPRYQFITDKGGKPDRLVSLQDGNVYDYNLRPSEPPGEALDHWQKLQGKYSAQGSALPLLTKVFRRNGYLYLKLMGIDLIMLEQQPGLFFTSTGEAVDFRGPEPVFAGVVMKKASLLRKAKFGLILAGAFLQMKLTPNS